VVSDVFVQDINNRMELWSKGRPMREPKQPNGGRTVGGTSMAWAAAGSKLEITVVQDAH